MIGQVMGCIVGSAILAGMTGSASECPPPPPAVIDIPGVSYYTDMQHSVRDPVLFRLNRQAMLPLDNYYRQIALMSDAFLRGDDSAGRCALIWLIAWAQQGALLGEPTAGRQSRSQRRWSAAAMGFVALKVWDAASDTDRALLQPYFRELAEAVRRDAATDGVRNNLLYWSALAVMVSTRLTGDLDGSHWAEDVCRTAIASLTPNGSLPLEDRRGERAVDYNGFALFPLSVIAGLSSDPASGCSTARLRPLANYILAHRSDTSDQYLRWAPFMGMDVAVEPRALFYAYGGGSLPLLASVLATKRDRP